MKRKIIKHMGDKPKRIKWTRELFIEKAKEKHGDKFDYSKVEFKGFCTKVLIKCNDCGEEFSQTPLQHLKTMYACPTCFYRCRRDGRKLPFERVLKEMTEKHQGRYTYEGVEEYYKNTESKIPITCPAHGVFWQSVHSHKAGIGCPKCGKQKSSTQIRISWEEFLHRAREKHGDKYEYNQEEYAKVSDSLNIRCKTCGKTFRQNATCHLSGQGCPYCANNVPLTTEEFIERANKVHEGKYSYDKVVYKNSVSKVCIICKEHGEFWQTSSSHLNGQGCPKCGVERNAEHLRLAYDEFIEKSHKRHQEAYDYSLAEAVFEGNKKKVPIICKSCGQTFYQYPTAHISGQGCTQCSHAKIWEKARSLSQEDFVKTAKGIYGDKYDYSGIIFVNALRKITLHCPICGNDFSVTPYSHIGRHKKECPICSKPTNGKYHTKTVEQCLAEFRELYGDRYAYEDIEKYYKNNRSVIPIICPIHGVFWKKVLKHKQGFGCPQCRNRTLEDRICQLLKSLNIEYIREQTFEWLFDKGSLRLDFFLPQYNIAIECQGAQHFRPVDFGGKGKEWAERQFVAIQKRDKIKWNLCVDNGVSLLYYNYNDDIIEFSMKIVNEIRKSGD